MASALPPLERLEVQGPAGPLEARRELPYGSPRCATVFAHPHPQFGGTMFNNVVVHASRELVSRGAVVLRFNFRGVGRSAGAYDGGRGEKADLAAVLAFAREEHPGVPLLAAGFSFGALRAFECAADGLADRYLGVAPLLSADTPGVVQVPAALVLAGADELVPAPPPALLAGRFAQLVHREVVAGASHLFPYHLEALRAAVGACCAALLDPA